MISRKNHIRHLSGNGVDPLLPEVPVRLVQHAHITTSGAALVGDLPMGNRDIVLSRNGEVLWQLGRGAVVADGPVVLAWQDARLTVVGIANVASVLGKRSALVDGLDQLLVCATGIGVSHIIQHGHGELAVGAASRAVVKLRTSDSVVPLAA